MTPRFLLTHIWLLCLGAFIPSVLFAQYSQTLDTVTVIGSQESLKQTPGSAYVLSEKELETSEQNDVHRVLRKVPGVYIREEEGFGLRPNIGMRGAGSERSSKVALMEDGILIAPAPYSAPAAYYFPLITRMQRVEVLKGPASIQHGPNTIGGALNMVSRAIPEEGSGQVDASLGDFATNKLHAYYGARYDQWGWLLEGVKLQSAGFQELDGDENTGFDKNDFLLKLSFNSDLDSDVYHQWDVKVGVSTEVSNASYVGLTHQDFKENPYRRYRATQNDQMDWIHHQYELRHYVDFGAAFDLTTVVYQNTFSRTWERLSGFEGADLASVLASPNTTTNQLFYDVLTGEADSSNLSETLLLVENERDFVSQGVQFISQGTIRGSEVQQELVIGVRFHQDQVERQHTERGYAMKDGELERDLNPGTVTTENLGRSEAMALYIQDQIQWNQWKISPGLRYESVSTHFKNKLTDESVDGSYQVVIPGVGVFYQLNPNWGLLTGVNKGFVPVSPGQIKEADPEESTNYELGTRYQYQNFSGEVIGFFSDYSNIKGTCTFSSGCNENQLDEEFDGGAIHTYGVETLFAGEWGSEDLRFPVNANYTYTQSSFQNTFTSSNPQWLDVEKGDELPYLPEHVLALQVGAKTRQWEVYVSSNIVSDMRDVAGQGDIPTEEKIPSQTVYDLASHYHFQNAGSVYVTIDNLMDNEYMVSRRPIGIRPGRRRLAQVGYKHSF